MESQSQKTQAKSPRMWVRVLGLSGGLLLIAVACQSPKTENKTVSWREGTSPLPEIFSSKAFQEKTTVWVDGELIEQSEQKIGPAKVRDGFRKLILSGAGKAKAGSLQAISVDQDTSELAPENLDKLQQNRFIFQQQIKSRKILSEDSETLGEPQLTVHQQAGRVIVTYAIDVLNKKLWNIERYYFTPDFKLVSQEKLSTDFEASGWIYTMANANLVEEVLFQNLTLSPALQSQNIKVATDAQNSATIRNAPWKFPVEDPRFDQVQVFYFLQNGLDFFAHQLDFTIPTLIQVQTSLGFPQQTNAAFTYQNQIRLGRGDDVTYSGLARDPTVVLHELSHIVVNAIARLPSQGEGGSLNEAFSDFFAAAALNNPKMGEKSFVAGPYKRNLADVIPYSAKNQGLYHDSQIVSGTLWSLRQSLPAGLGQRLALRTLTRLNPNSVLADFPTALKEAADELLNADQKIQMHQILDQFEWPHLS